VPHAAAGLHPLHATSGEHSGLAGAVGIAHIALGHEGQGGDAGVWVHAEAPLAMLCVEVHQLKIDEGLERLTQVARAHQAGDGTVLAALGAVHDSAGRMREGRELQCQTGGTSVVGP
jgi:hypothetical protein